VLVSLSPVPSSIEIHPNSYPISSRYDFFLSSFLLNSGYILLENNRWLS